MQSRPKFAVLLFAAARELAGVDHLLVSPPSGVRYMSVAQLREELARQCPKLAELLRVSAIAVNHDIAEDALLLMPLDEVAIIPPVSGG